MKKNISILVSAAALLPLLFSCNKAVEPASVPENGLVTISASIPDGPATDHFGVHSRRPGDPRRRGRRGNRPRLEMGRKGPDHRRGRELVRLRHRRRLHSPPGRLHRQAGGRYFLLHPVSRLLQFRGGTGGGFLDRPGSDRKRVDGPSCVLRAPLRSRCVRNLRIQRRLGHGAQRHLQAERRAQVRREACQAVRRGRDSRGGTRDVSARRRREDILYACRGTGGRDGGPPDQHASGRLRRLGVYRSSS